MSLICFFIRTDLEKFCITSLSQKWILCSEWVPSAWRVQTADKNVIYSTSNPQASSTSINVLWNEKLHVYKKQIHNLCILTLNLCFWINDLSIIHNDDSSGEKVHPLLSSHINPPTYLFRTILFSFVKSVHISLLIQMNWLFHWRKQYYS